MSKYSCFTNCLNVKKIIDFDIKEYINKYEIILEWSEKKKIECQNESSLIQYSAITPLLKDFLKDLKEMHEKKYNYNR